MKIDYINDLISTKYYSTNKELFKYIDIKTIINLTNLKHVRIMEPFAGNRDIINYFKDELKDLKIILIIYLLHK